MGFPTAIGRDPSMTRKNVTIHLQRLSALASPDISDKLASQILLRKMQDHGIKVYVGVPNGSCAIEDSLGPLSVSLADAARLKQPLLTVRIQREINDAARLDKVIRYGAERPEISFLELDRSNVAEMISSGRTELHWFEGRALRAANSETPGSPPGLASLPVRLRCLRPLGDAEEKQRRFQWGGALKLESAFCYSFGVHDTLVDEVDADLLRFVLEAPSEDDDPFLIRQSSPAVYFAYRAAKKFHLSLLNRTAGRETVIGWLRAMNRKTPDSPYVTDYVADQVAMLLDPYHRRGRGFQKLPLDLESLRWFRKEFPAEKELSDGFALLICASLWWVQEHRRHVAKDRTDPPATWDLHKKLGLLGFSGKEETDALVQVVAWKETASKAVKKNRSITKR
jgi:hypothetical protein